MPKLREKEIDFSMEQLSEVVEQLSTAQLLQLLEKLYQLLQNKNEKLLPFQADEIEAILKDFHETGLYEKEFLKDLEEGLRKSSVYS